MQLHEVDIPLICPACRSPRLSGSAERFHCKGCRRDYPVRHGIPDFRLADDPYADREAEHLARVLPIYNSDRATYLDMVELKYARAGASEDLQHAYMAYDTAKLERGAERLRQFEMLLREAGRAGVVTGRRCLDIGTGSGGTLSALAGRFDLAVGVDVSLVELLYAKKFLEDHPNTLPVCASAEALPFAPEAMDLINATDVIEHVPSAGRMLREMRRLLSPQGRLFFNSPNRFSLMSPEPHARLWGMGFLPRALMQPYVQLRRRGEYKQICLLSYFELERLLTEVFGERFLIHGMILDRADPEAPLRRRVVQRLPFLLQALNRYLKPVIPHYQVAVLPVS